MRTIVYCDCCRHIYDDIDFREIFSTQVLGQLNDYFKVQERGQICRPYHCPQYIFNTRWIRARYNLPAERDCIDESTQAVRNLSSVRKYGIKKFIDIHLPWYQQWCVSYSEPAERI